MSLQFILIRIKPFPYIWALTLVLAESSSLPFGDVSYISAVATKTEE
jgi:hypothetical protein